MFTNKTYGEPTHTPALIVTKQDVEQAIKTKALQYHIDPELLVRVARCESGLRIDAKNKISTASGVFQFIDSTFVSQYQKYFLSSPNMNLKNDPLIQIDLASRMIADGGITHWTASKDCWIEDSKN